MAVIPVELAGREYEVRIGTGLLADVAGQARPFLRKPHVCIVADESARAHAGRAVAARIASGATFLALVPAGALLD